MEVPNCCAAVMTPKWFPLGNCWYSKAEFLSREQGVSMAFKNAICPSCSKNVQIPTDVEQAACMYCGAKINVGINSPAGSSNLDNLLGMARTALVAGNHLEAMDYFNRVLELDPRVSEAWMGKGAAAGWQSTMVNIRLPETVIAFNHGIANASPKDKLAVTRQASEELNKMVVALYNLARNHLMDYVALDNSWASYLAQVSQLLDGLDQALNWVPDDLTTLGNIIHLCKDNIEGVSYRDPYDQNASKVWLLSPQYEVSIRSRLDAAAARMGEIDSSYRPPAVEKKKPDDCFVVTATMGDSNHPTVIFMRQFRDEKLLTRKAGRRFVSWYYSVGPVAARFIREYVVLRKLSFAIIVAPSAWLARRWLGRG
jgi:tetratricopeptide (TPR) repeat protein